MVLPLDTRDTRAYPTLLECQVAEKLLHRADRHGAVSSLLQRAGPFGFTQTILGTDATADFRKIIGGFGKAIGFLEAPFGGQSKPVRDVVVQRAINMTIGHAALLAARCLPTRFFFAEPRCNLLEIVQPLLNRPLFRRSTRDIYVTLRCARRRHRLFPWPMYRMV